MGLLMGLGLVLAAGITVLETGFLRLTYQDIQQVPDRVRVSQWYKLILQQDQVLGALRLAYGLFALVTVVGANVYLLPQNGVGIFALNVALCGLALVVLTRLVPQTYVLRQNTDFALGMTLMIRIVYMLFKFPAICVNGVATLLTAPFKHHFIYRPSMVMTADYAALVHRAEESVRQDDPAARSRVAMQHRLEEYAHVNVGHVMTPLEEIEAIDGDQPIEEMVDLVMESGAKRMILYQDNPDNIVGILHTNLFAKAVALAGGDLNAVDVMSAVSEPYLVSPNVQVIEQIRQFRQNRQNYALVRHRDGDILGGVSLNRLLQQVAHILDAE